jgi:hypothetical protein
MSSISHERKRRAWFRFTRKNPKVMPYLEKINEESPRSARMSLKEKKSPSSTTVSPHLEKLPSDSLKLARMRLKTKPQQTVLRSRAKPVSSRHLFNIFSRKRRTAQVNPNDVELEFTGLVPNNRGGRKNRTQRRRK